LGGAFNRVAPRVVGPVVAPLRGSWFEWHEYPEGEGTRSEQASPWFCYCCSLSEPRALATRRRQTRYSITPTLRLRYAFAAAHHSEIQSWPSCLPGQELESSAVSKAGVGYDWAGWLGLPRKPIWLTPQLKAQSRVDTATLILVAFGFTPRFEASMEERRPEPRHSAAMAPIASVSRAAEPALITEVFADGFGDPNQPFCEMGCLLYQGGRAPVAWPSLLGTRARHSDRMRSWEFQVKVLLPVSQTCSLCCQG
jgi:hypothetical protein